MTPFNHNGLPSSPHDSAATNLPEMSKLVVLITTSVANFFSSFMGSALNIALPRISHEFQASALLLGWMVTAYLLTSGVFVVPFGRISDMVGIKKIFSYGMILYTVASLAAMLSVSGEMLLAFRIVQGIAAAMIFGNTSAMITAAYPAGQRGRALGINTGAVYLGLSSGPFLGGILTAHFGWRSLFLMNVIAGAIVILFIFWKIQGEFTRAKKKKFDLAGSIIYGIALICIMYGFSTLPSISGIVLVLSGGLLAVVFIKWENRVESPVLEISLFKNNRVFVFSNLAALLNYSATASITFLLSLYLQYIKGFTPDRAGLVILTQPVLQAIVAPLAGRLSDKIEPRIVSSIGMAMVAMGLTGLSFLDDNSSIVQIIILLIVLGAGFGLFSSPNANAVMSSVTPGYYGIAAATLATMRVSGQVLSMGVTLVLFGILIGPVVIAPQNYPALLISAKIAFTVSAVLCIGGIFASLARGNMRVSERINKKE